MRTSDRDSILPPSLAGFGGRPGCAVPGVPSSISNARAEYHPVRLAPRAWGEVRPPCHTERRLQVGLPALQHGIFACNVSICPNILRGGGGSDRQTAADFG